MSDSRTLFLPKIGPEYKLERSVYKQEQYSSREYIEIAWVLQDIPVIFDNVVIKLLKADINLTKKLTGLL